MTPVSVSAASIIVVLVIMAMELRLSRRNEKQLRAWGAREPADDVYRTMRWAYPAAFVVMAIEGAAFGPEPGRATAAGVIVLAASKLLKGWAIAALGPRWTFRVLVMAGVPLVTRGPYAVMRHPNYVAVLGELAGMALLVGARVTGPLATVLFGLLIRRRIAVEDRALGTSLAPKP
jgi:methyltransferase